MSHGEPALQWAEVAAKGGIRDWVDAEIGRRGLTDPGVPSSMTDAEKKLYKARREEERRVRRELYKQAWSAYKRAHIVHLGPGVFWHDTADVDRFDADDPERKRQDNALPAARGRRGAREGARHDDPAAALARVPPRGRQRHALPPLARAQARRLAAPDLGAQAGPQGASSAGSRARSPSTCRSTARRTASSPGRSIVTNATVHATARIVVKLDIKGFYPTVTTRRVKGLLRRAGLGEQVATLLALLVTESPREEVVTHGKHLLRRDRAALAAAGRADEPVDHERAVPAPGLPAVRSRAQARLPLHALRRRPDVLAGTAASRPTSACCCARCG